MDYTSFDEILVHKMRDPRTGVSIQDRSWFLRNFKKCFIGSELVTWMLKTGVAKNKEDALKIGNSLLSRNFFHHVTDDHTFKDEELFYRFQVDEEGNENNPWFFEDYTSSSLQPELRRDTTTVPSALSHSTLIPDEFNEKLLLSVHPRSWNNPSVPETYNLVVIGAGAGGLVSASGAAAVGAKVAIIERNLMGGDCLNFGCVPSKSLLASAKRFFELKNSCEFGIKINGSIEIDFEEVMKRMRRLRADISSNDSCQRFKDLGVDVFIGEAQFLSSDTIKVKNTILKFSKAIIASGATPSVPIIPGLQDCNYLTNETLFNLAKLPKTFAIIGSSAVSCEMAQAFARFGSKVTIFARSSLLSREDPEAVKVLQSQLLNEGINIICGAQIQKVQQAESSITISYQVKDDGVVKSKCFEEVLVATGRSPNVDMNLEAANIKYDRRSGIFVSETLQTSNPDVYAVGDCCTVYMFTHMADAMARLAIRNSLFFGTGKVSDLVIPWCTYTQPELAHVGMYESDLINHGIEYDIFKVKFSDNDRAILDGYSEGFVKVYTKTGTDVVLSATIVGEGAGNMISQFSYMITNKLGLSTFSSVIYPYPTTGDAVRKTGDLYNQTRLTQTVHTLFRTFLEIRR